MAQIRRSKGSASAAKKTGKNRITLQHWHVLILLAGLILLVYIRTLSFGTISFDDHLLVGQTKLNSFRHILAGFRESYFSDVYRPLLFATFAFDAILGKGAVLWYHIDNLVIHLVACLLTYTLLVITGCTRRLSAFLAALLGVHPLLVPAVAWIPGRNDSLLAITVVLAVIGVLRYAATKDWKYLLLFAVMNTAALFIKETAIVLPVVCLPALWVVQSVDRAIFVRLGSVWLVGAAMYGLLRLVAVFPPAADGAMAEQFSVSSARMLAQLPTIPELIGKSLIPINLSEYPVHSTISSLLGCMVMLAGIVFIIYLRREQGFPLVFWGGLWMIGLLLPPLFRGSVPGEYDYLEHRMYVPFIGLLLMVAGVHRSLPYPLPPKHLAKLWHYRFYGAWALVALFAVITAIRCPYYTNAEKFWTRALNVAPHSVYALNALGNIHLATNNYTTAGEYFQQAVHRLPDDPRSISNLGISMLRSGKAREAEQYFIHALTLDSTRSEYWFNLGSARYSFGGDSLFTTTKHCYERALFLDSSSADVYIGLIVIHYNRKEYTPALLLAQRAAARGIRLSERQPALYRALKAATGGAL